MSTRDQKLRDEGRKLRSEASEALRKGQLRKALARYRSLETREPGDAHWSCRVADIEARLGEKTGEIAALVRASERYASGGFLLRAIAICKRILDLDPSHTTAQDRLASFHAAQGPQSPPPHVGAAIPENGPPLAPGALSEILLDEVAVPRPSLPARVHALPLGPEAEAGAVAERVLPRVPLFGDLGPSAFRRLLQVVRLVRLREDSILFREGDPGDALYLIVDGAVVPCAERPTRRRLAVLQEGDFFGEIALVTDQPRIATVRALVDTTLLVLDADSIRSMIREEPGLMVVFLRFLRERLLHRLGQTSPLFSFLDTAGTRGLASGFRFLDVEDGADLVTQGAHVRGLFVCLCGRFEVTAHDGTEVRTLSWLEMGDVFGEMSLLSGAPAMASVTARGRGFVLALDEAAFDALAARQPALLEGLRALAGERESRNEQPLRDAADAFRRPMDLV